MFNTINYLLNEKRKPELDADLLQAFNPFITQKTFSYYDSGRFCGYINDSLNLYSNVFKTVEDQFRFYEVMIPVLKRRKSEYIKKPKKTEKDESIPLPEFLSRREVDLYETLSK